MYYGLLKEPDLNIPVEEEEEPAEGDGDKPKVFELSFLNPYNAIYRTILFRGVEIPCPTCLNWSNFIQDKLKISIYLSLDKYKCIK